MTSRMLSRHAPQFQLSLPTRSLQPVAVVSTPSPADMKAAGADAAAWRTSLRCVYNNSSNNTNNTAATQHEVPKQQQQMQGYSRFDASEIFHNLFLGSWIDADSIDDLKAHNVTRILNVAEECPVSSSCEAAMACGSIQVKKLFLRDHSDEDIAVHLPEALEFVHEGILHNEGVLVHCRQGVSRSATIVLAYLMRFGVQDPTQAATKGPMSYADAFDFVKEKRPLISPNLGFVLALHEVERATASETMKNGGSATSSTNGIKITVQSPQPLSACA